MKVSSSHAANGKDAFPEKPYQQGPLVILYSLYIYCPYILPIIHYTFRSYPSYVRLPKLLIIYECCTQSGGPSYVHLIIIQTHTDPSRGALGGLRTTNRIIDDQRKTLGVDREKIEEYAVELGGSQRRLKVEHIILMKIKGTLMVNTKD
jgi:hypothetical protein